MNDQVSPLDQMKAWIYRGELPWHVLMQAAQHYFGSNIQRGRYREMFDEAVARGFSGIAEEINLLNQAYAFGVSDGRATKPKSQGETP